MANNRKKFPPEEKVRLLCLHLVEKVPVSDICDQHGIGLRPWLNQKVGRNFTTISSVLKKLYLQEMKCISIFQKSL